MTVTSFDNFVYRLIMSCRTLGKIPGISRMTPAAACIRATRSYCISTWMAPLATDGLDVDAPSLTQPDTIGFPFLGGVHKIPDVRDFRGDGTWSCVTNTNSSGVIRDVPGNFQRVWHDVIRWYTKGMLSIFSKWIKWCLLTVFQLSPLPLS